MATEDPATGRTPQGRFVKGVSGNPTGVRRQDRDPEATAARTDGWTSAITGIGYASRDKRLGHTFGATQIGYRQVIELWRGDDIAKRAIEAPAGECFRQGYEITVGDEEDLDDLREKLETRAEELMLDQLVERAYMAERAFGGSALLIGANDGQPLDQPLDLDRLISIDWISVLEPVEVYPLIRYEDPSKPKFGQTKIYQLNALPAGSSIGGFSGQALPSTTTLVHESRLIVFEGVRVSKFQDQNSITGAHWGDSVLTQFHEVLRDFNVAFAAAGILVTDFSVATLAVENLSNLVQHDSGRGLQARLTALDMARSVARTVLIDSKETYRRETTTLTGLSDLLDRLCARLAAAVDMPLTLLMGQSPKGLGNEGDSDIRFYYDRIKQIQKRKIKPALRKLYQIILRTLTKSEPKKWDIKFHPLWQESDAEKATARATQATTDEKYFMMGALTDKEIRKARFSGEYSFETQVDDEDLDAQEMANQGPLDPAAMEAAGHAPGAAPGAATGAAPVDPLTVPLGAPGAVDPSKTAMNGAQVSALVSVIASAANKEISRESAIGVLMVAFQVSEADANRMLGPVNFKPSAPPPPKGGFPPKGGGGGFPPKGGGAPPPKDKKAAAIDRLDVALADAESAGASAELIDDLRASLRDLRADFDPDQPRDEDGKWGEGGGGGASKTTSRGSGGSGGSAGDPGAKVSPGIRTKIEAAASRPGRSQIGDEDGSRPPKPGEPFMVFRMGRSGKLENKNAGNAEGVAGHIARSQDIERPAPGGGYGDKIFVSMVTVDQDFGDFVRMNEGKGDREQTAVGRTASAYTHSGYEGGRGEVAYSFPAGGAWKAEPVVSFTVEGANRYLKEATGGKYEDFDSAGTALGAAHLREYVKSLSERDDGRADYDPDQPRDENGRWGEGGGGSAKPSPNDTDRRITGAGSSSRGPAEPSERQTKGLAEISERVRSQMGDLDRERATPKELPDEPERYFKKDPDTEMVTVDKLKAMHQRPGGIDRASQNMAKAYNGEGEKREPILVGKNPDGTYEVVDGNSTLAVAREQGWKEVPVKMLPPVKSSIDPPFYSPEQSAAMVERAKPMLESLRERSVLPSEISADRHVEIAREFLSKHEAGLPAAMERFTAAAGGPGVVITGRSKDIGSALVKVAERTEKEHARGVPLQYQTAEKLMDGTGMRAIAPTRSGAMRAAEAIEKRYTIVHKDDYTEKPQPGGYRALHYVVKDSDGLHKEIQVQTRRQQTFQHWSHDVYKPLTPDQRSVLQRPGARDKINAYAEAVSEYLHLKDRGIDSDPPAPLDEEYARAFGKVRLDAAQNRGYTESAGTDG